MELRVHGRIEGFSNYVLPSTMINRLPNHPMFLLLDVKRLSVELPSIS